MRYPITGWFGKILLKWMIWMYPYVRKPIFSNVFSNNWLNQSRFVFRVDIVHPWEWDGWRNHKQAVCIQHPSMHWIRFKNSDPASNRFWSMHTISSSMFLAKNDPYPSYFNPWQELRLPSGMSISVTVVTAFDLWDVWYIPAIPSHGLLKVYWLVVWNTWIIFPYIGNSDPNWLICFRGVETTSQYKSIIDWDDWDAQGIPYCSGPNPPGFVGAQHGSCKASGGVEFRSSDV